MPNDIPSSYLANFAILCNYNLEYNCNIVINENIIVDPNLPNDYATNKGDITNTGTGSINGELISPSGLTNPNVIQLAINELVKLQEYIYTFVALPVKNIPSQTTYQGYTSAYVFVSGYSYKTTTNINLTNSTIIFDANNNSNAVFTIASPGSITLKNVNIVLLNGAKAGNIFWVAQTLLTITFDSSYPSSIPSSTTNPPTEPVLSGIFIASYAFIIDTNVNLKINGNLFTSVDQTSQYVINKYDSQLDSSSGIKTITINPQLSNPLPIELLDPTCYAKGTKILTKRGYIPIENLTPVDKIVTKGKIYGNRFIQPSNRLKLEPVVSINKFTIKSLTKKTCPICIERNTFGPNSPYEDLYVSPNHSVFVNGRMIKAEELLNGTTVTQKYFEPTVDYYHVELEEHSTIIANGVLSESYLESNNRNIFESSLQGKKHFVKHNMKYKNIMK